MRILLLGAKGQVGSEVMILAKQRQIEVDAFDLDTLDITDRNRLSEVIHACSDVSVVINSAAYTAVDKAEHEQRELAYQVNAVAVKNLAEICRDCDLPLLHLSTDYVFDGNHSIPYQEEDNPHPLSVYGQSKLEGDQAIQRIWEKHVIVRISWVFGRYGHNFVKTILRLAKEKTILTIVGDQYGCPTAAQAVADVLLTIAKQLHRGQPHFGLYHYCNQPATTWHAFATTIVGLAKQHVSLAVQEVRKIATADYPTAATRPKYSVMQAEKITEDYGILSADWLPFLQEVMAAIAVND